GVEGVADGGGPQAVRRGALTDKQGAGVSPPRAWWQLKPLITRAFLVQPSQEAKENAMTPTREGLEQIRHQLAQHVQRGEQIITNAESYRDWPTHCDGSTMLYAVEVSINALSILERAAEAVGRP